MDSEEGGFITKFSLKIVNHNPTYITTLSAISLVVNLDLKAPRHLLCRFLHQFDNVEGRPERWSPTRNSGHFQ